LVTVIVVGDVTVLTTVVVELAAEAGAYVNVEVALSAPYVAFTV